MISAQTLRVCRRENRFTLCANAALRVRIMLLVRRLLPRALCLRRFHPPDEIVGKAREGIGQRLAAVVQRVREALVVDPRGFEPLTF